MAVLLCSIVVKAHDFEVDGIYYNIISSSETSRTEVEVTCQGDNIHDSYSGDLTIPVSVTYDGEVYSVTGIEFGVLFSYSLTSVTCHAVTPPIVNAATSFGPVDTSIPIYVHESSIPTYQATEYWSEFSNYQAIVIPEAGWRSDNQGQGNSSSSKTYAFTTDSDGEFSFDWKVSSETGCDRLIVALNGVEILNESGEMSGKYESFISSGVYTLVVEYVKDFSVDGGDDYAEISNIVYAASSNSSYYSGFCGKNVTWKLLENGELIIEGTGEMYNYAQFNPVTPWYECREMINTITIFTGVTSIGEWAFYDCSSLTSITIPESVTSIGEHAFSDCSSLTSITIPESVTSIEGWAFLHCTSLTSITIPANVINIGYGILMGCNGLVSVVVEVGNPVYDSRYNCNAIIETSSNTLVGGCSATIIPNGITSIGNRAFCYCDFTSISIPKSVKTIDDYAFVGSSLTSITIPEGVTSIGREAFYNCKNLTAITLPESVTSIGGYAFSGTPWYKNQPDGVVYVNNVLYEYKGTMPANTSIEVREGTVSISYDAFSGCSSLAAITLPEGVTSIGDDAFYGCSSLTAITCDAITPPAIGGTQTFDGVDKSIPVYVPAGSVDAYKAAEYWSGFTNILPLANEFTLTVSAAGYATLFLGYDVAIPDGVEVYIATSVEGDRLKMTQITDVLPAGTGVIVRAKAGIYTFTEIEGEYDAIEGNLLVGTTENTYITAAAGYNYYVLAQKDGVVGMYRPKLTNGQFLNNANKAYLALDMGNLGIFDDETNTDEEGGQLSNRLRFDFGGTTGIGNSQFTIDSSQLTIHDLHGRRITDTEGLKGVYIVNGKKVVFK